MGIERNFFKLYLKVIINFEDAEKVKKNYEILDKMLHPKNHLRKILQIQMAGFMK